ncbi:MAG: M23 family metallopeptidase [Nitrospirota bacterium]
MFDRKIYLVIFIFLIIAAFAFLKHAPAIAVEVEIFPNEISPGDAFVIKITDAKISHLPSAALGEKKFYFSKCRERCFIAIGAVDLKTEAGIYPVELNIGEEKKNIKLLVRDIKFPTQELTLPDDKVFLSPENLKRVESENKKLDEIFQEISERLWDSNFILPLKNDISTGFGIQRIINQKIISVHRGVDIQGEEGEEVTASNKGRVVFTGKLFFGGNTVILDHGQGIYTIYMHLSEFNVKPRDIISQGEVIGHVGSTGRSSGPHLHFGIKVLNTNVNPVSFTKLHLL